MSHPRKMIFSQTENLNAENYHDTKKLTVSKKKFTYFINFFARDKNVAKSPLIFESGFTNKRWPTDSRQKFTQVIS